MPSPTAPYAPGQLGAPVEPQAFLRYLGLLDEWIRARRSELDSLDAVAQQRHTDAATGDLVLSMALWQACRDRYELLVATWDSGRVGLPEREKLASLVFGRMETTAPTPGGTALSLPEACRLSDALVAQLRTRLQLTPDADALASRVAAVRATVERLRDQVQLEPAAEQAAVAARVEAFAQRADDVYAKASRGGDVGGLIGPLELESAEFERDLIVGGAQRRETRAAHTAAVERVAELGARAEALDKLVARSVDSVVEAPKYAVPDVAALGAPPTDAAALAAYNARLDQVSRALQVVQQAYSTSLAQLGQLMERATGAFARVDATGGVDPDVTELRQLTERLLHRRPTSIRVVGPLVTALEAATTAPDPGQEQR